MMNLVPRSSTGCASEWSLNWCDFNAEYLFSFLISIMDGIRCVFVRNVTVLCPLCGALEDYIWVLIAPFVS